MTNENANIGSRNHESFRRPGPAETSGNQQTGAQTSARNTTPARKGTKGARIIALLQKPSGVSLKGLLKATGWQAHSVRAFLSAYVGKRLGLPVKSSEREGQRVYAIEK